MTSNTEHAVKCYKNALSFNYVFIRTDLRFCCHVIHIIVANGHFPYLLSLSVAKRIILKYTPRNCKFFSKIGVLLLFKANFIIYSIGNALQLGTVYCHAPVFHYYKIIFPFLKPDLKITVQGGKIYLLSRSTNAQHIYILTTFYIS